MIQTELSYIFFDRQVIARIIGMFPITGILSDGRFSQIDSAYVIPNVLESPLCQTYALLDMPS